MNQSTVRTLVLIALIPFSVLTAIALWVDGITGIFASIISSWGSAQIYVDLVIAVVLISFWMYRDAKERGRNPWPWILASFVVGCFSPLVYLLVRDSARPE